MEAQTLVVEARSEVGKRVAGRLRRKGELPGVFYGKKIGNIPVTIPAKEMESILAQEGENAILKIQLADNDGNQEFAAVVREVQRHPLKRKLTHVDLYQISLEDKLKALVPLFLEGEAAGIKEGGVLQQSLRELEVEALPTDLPDSFVVDVTNLSLGEHLTVADVKVPEAVKMLSEPETVIATVVAVRTLAEEEAEEADAEADAEVPAEETEIPEEEQEA